jgi:hypothetical protein
MSEFEPEADEAVPYADEATPNELMDEPPTDAAHNVAADNVAADNQHDDADDDAAEADAVGVEDAPIEPASSAASGDPTVAAALAELATLDELELAAHPDVYERIHGELQRALSSIDDA